ncbi:nnaa [Actinobacillus equuli]|nr:nnaa [Actinobacillus equuli]
MVTAMHLDAQYGNTVTVIEQDGFEIAARIPLTLNAEITKRLFIRWRNV